MRDKLQFALELGGVILSLLSMYACYGLVGWVTTPTPFATAAECQRALAYLEKHAPSQEPEWCAELERGGWCAFAYDPGSGRDRCFMP
jgi:hypothetical protein